MNLLYFKNKKQESFFIEKRFIFDNRGFESGKDVIASPVDMVKSQR